MAKTAAELDRDIAAYKHGERGDRIVADLESWGVDAEQVDEVRALFRAGKASQAMAIARDLGWNRAAKRGRSHR